MIHPEIEIASLAKHANEALILAVLSRGDRHGYQIAVEIEEESGGKFTFNHGTLYPILHKLEKEGMIKGLWKRSTTKRKRKYYTLTKDGKNYFDEQCQGFYLFFTCLFDIIGRKK